MTILSIEPLTNNFKNLLIAITIITLLVSCSVAIVGIEKGKKKSTIISTIIFEISAIGFFYGVVYMPDYLPNKYQYYVELDDLDDAADILSDYKLIENHGNVYIIEDR